MREFLKARWPLLAVLAIFIACKIPHLLYPYYWDESWPYAVAIRDMYNHGISLMPTAIDPELSRGHPLFFHAIAALWMHIFGPSHLSMHSFALLISVVGIIGIYEAGLKLFSQRVAVLGVLLVSTQILFFVQSSFVLFEVLIGVLVFYSLFFYSLDKYLLTIFCLSALFYTKESGLILGFVLGIDALIGLFNKNTEWRVRLLRLATIAVPCILIGVFFIIQKYVRGWYIFPFYNDLIERRWDIFWYNFRINCLYSTFIVDYRYRYFVIVLALAVVAAIKNRNVRYMVFFLPAYCIYYFVDDMRAGRILPSVPFFLVFVFSIIMMLIVLAKLKMWERPRSGKFIVLSVAFIFCFLCFSSLNFFTPRYLLTVIFLLLLFCAVAISWLSERSYRLLYIPATLLCMAVSARTFWKDNDYGDGSLGAFNGMNVQQHVVDWFESRGYFDRSISCRFLEEQHLVNPATGFLRGHRGFAHVKGGMDNNTEFLIFDSIEGDQKYEQVKADPRFELLDRYQKGVVWAEIYGRRNVR